MRSFRCATDGDFDITADCLTRFCKLDLAKRHRVLNRAIQFGDPDARPCISNLLIDKELASEECGLAARSC
jgi:hypothetical protein